ncbi:MAG: PAS domain S-box protein [Myxococcales bacterium]|nr:PAS domain S-box protein [Myxococcales bacterium]
MPDSPRARGPATAGDPFEIYRPKLLFGLCAGAAVALLIGMTATALQRPLEPLEWAGFWTALVCFCTAPFALRRTGSMLAAASLLLAGGAVSIFVPAYFTGGLQAPQVIWLLVVPMLAPLYFGSRVTLSAGGVSLVAFALLFALEIVGTLPAPMPDPAKLSTFLNLALATGFVMAVSISTHRAMLRSRRELLELKQQVEHRSEELAESERRKSAIIDSAMVGLISADATGCIVDFNPAAAQILGYTREQAIGRRVTDFMVPPSMRKAQWTAYLRALARPDAPLESAPRSLIALRSDGEEIPVEVVLQRISAGGPARFMAQLRDLRIERRTEAMVRQREEQLQRAQRLEDVGRLAGGVAHDFNNLLTIIGGYSENIETDPTASASIRKQAREVSLAAERAGSITRQLLAFSRGQELKLEPVALGEVLSEFRTTICSLLPPSVKLNMQPAPPRWPVRANRSEIERIVVNLVMNAADAMPGGGQLSIHTEYLGLDIYNPQRPPDLEPGSYARLSVIDDGEGMEPEVLSRAFEPFFTTKEVGRGTGLGLASVYGAVRQFGGHVDLESAPGRGTGVSIYLPRDSWESSPGLPRNSERIQLARPRSILLAEDESSIRRLIVTRLRTEGYRVLEAADGQEALMLTELREEAVDLLISDVVMPRRSGTSLARELRTRQPDLPLIFISGFVGNAQLNLARDFPGAAFMQKPLRFDELIDAVKRLLEPESAEPDADQTAREAARES